MPEWSGIKEEHDEDVMKVKVKKDENEIPPLALYDEYRLTVKRQT